MHSQIHTRVCNAVTLVWAQARPNYYTFVGLCIYLLGFAYFCILLYSSAYLWIHVHVYCTCTVPLCNFCIRLYHILCVTHSHAHIPTHTHTHTPTHPHTPTHTHPHTPTHTHTHTHTHTPQEVALKEKLSNTGRALKKRYSLLPLGDTAPVTIDSSNIYNRAESPQMVHIPVHVICV